MKRVLQVVYNMDCGGIEKFIINMNRESIKNDIIFDYVYMNDDSKSSYYDEEIKKLGGKIYYIGKLNLIRLPKFAFLFRHVLKNNGPYISLHVHSFYNCGLISFLGKCFGQKNIVTHSHTTVDNKVSHNVFRKVYIWISKKLINKYSDHKLACGVDAGKALYNNSNFVVINNGIDISKFEKINDNDMKEFKKSINLQQDELLISHVGNFFDVKNHDYLIKIAKALKDDNFKYKMIFVGTGSNYDKILSLVNKYDLNSNILMLGLRNDVEKILLSSDVFVFPSKYEGMPISLIEAQTAGLHCIVSNTIDKNINLNINKMDFIGIQDDNIEEWTNAIKNNVKKCSINKSIRCLRNKKMDLESNYLKLQSIYIGDYNEKN